MKTLVIVSAFKKDFKKQGLSSELITVLYHLINDKPLPEKYKDHRLIGNLNEFRECHVRPDLLLLYQIKDSTLVLVRLTSHSELF